MTLSRADLFERPATTGLVRIAIEDPPGEVCMRPLSGAEVTSIHQAESQPDRITRAIVARSLCDENGARICEQTDGDAVFNLPYATVRTLVDNALRLNRMTAEAVADAKKA